MLLQKEKIGNLTQTLAERSEIIRIRRETEASLTSEAMTLIEMLDRSVSNGSTLYQALTLANNRDCQVARKASGAVRNAVDAAHSR